MLALRDAAYRAFDKALSLPRSAIRWAIWWAIGRWVPPWTRYWREGTSSVQVFDATL